MLVFPFVPDHGSDKFSPTHHRPERNPARVGAGEPLKVVELTPKRQPLSGMAHQSRTGRGWSAQRVRALRRRTASVGPPRKSKSSSGSRPATSLRGGSLLLTLRQSVATRLAGSHSPAGIPGYRWAASDRSRASRSRLRVTDGRLDTSHEYGRPAATSTVCHVTISSRARSAAASPKCDRSHRVRPGEL
jgi:hypothetical protein